MHVKPKNGTNFYKSVVFSSKYLYNILDLQQFRQSTSLYDTHPGEKFFVFFTGGGLRLAAPSRVISGSGISRTALLFTHDWATTRQEEKNILDLNERRETGRFGSLQEKWACSLNFTQADECRPVMGSLGCLPAACALAWPLRLSSPFHWVSGGVDLHPEGLWAQRRDTGRALRWWKNRLHAGIKTKNSQKTIFFKNYCFVFFQSNWPFSSYFFF